ncbi:MAG: ABC transporter ATP-binding protein [Lentisphaeria bacterium]|nr:ABC transporter ATP-binding protein [Lentisphaeria bacterium]
MAVSNEPIIQATELQKTFFDFWHRPKAQAVRGIDLKICKGQVFGLLGPNGSGKSTTVKMILGLLSPSAGSLKVMGQKPRHVNTKMQIGYLPEETYLYKYLTARETLEFYGSLFKLSKQQCRKRTNELLEMVGLSDAANRYVGEYSKGMARRIGLAQALINDPELIILDEPTSGLDPIGCREVKDIIQTLRNRGKTVLLCSHLLADVEDLCDEVAIMYGGKVRASGELKDLLRVHNQTRIVTDHLSESTLDQIKALIQKEIESPDLVQVDHPAVTLEDYFLKIVREARNDNQSTYGAQSNGQIAKFLKSEESTGHAILEKLHKPEKEEVVEESEQQTENVDVQRLENLQTNENVETTVKVQEDQNKEMTIEEKKNKSDEISNLLKK